MPTFGTLNPHKKFKKQPGRFQCGEWAFRVVGHFHSYASLTGTLSAHVLHVDWIRTRPEVFQTRSSSLKWQMHFGKHMICLQFGAAKSFSFKWSPQIENRSENLWNSELYPLRPAESPKMNRRESFKLPYFADCSSPRSIPTNLWYRSPILLTRRSCRPNLLIKQLTQIKNTIKSHLNCW